MSENTKLWDILGRTDPKHVKPFTRGGGFKGTAIKPMWSYRRMTEEFGPCGIGWGVGEPRFEVIHAGDEILVYCTASVWFKSGDESSQTVWGVGGDKVVAKFSSGSRTDDEAFKKAFTDAVTNALKLIGVGADVHMGMFDDNKYVNSMKQEFADDVPNTFYSPRDEGQKASPPPKSSAALKRSDANGEDAWDRLTKELYQDFLDCKTLDGLAKLRADYRAKARDARWPKAWLEALAGEFDQFEEGLVREMEKEPAE